MESRLAFVKVLAGVGVEESRQADETSAMLKEYEGKPIISQDQFENLADLRQIQHMFYS